MRKRTRHAPRWVLREEIDAVADFIHQGWRANHIMSRNKDLLAWQFENRADQDLLNILITEDDDGFRSFLGGIECDFRVRGEVYAARFLSFWFTREGIQGGDSWLLLTKMMKSADLVGTQGFSESAKQVYEGLGFQILNQTPRYFLALNTQQLTSMLSEQRINSIVSEFCQLSSAEGSIADYATVDDGQWDEFWNRYSQTNFVGVDRHSYFINHRFLTHPVFHYHVKVLQNESDGILGYAVYHVVETEDFSVMRLSDLLATTEEAVSTLVGHVVNVGHKMGVAYIDCITTNISVGRVLQGSGFVKENPDLYLPYLLSPPVDQISRLNLTLWSSKTVSQADLLVDSNLHITTVECDQDRPN